MTPSTQMTHLQNSEKNKCLLFKPRVYCILLWQPEKPATMFEMLRTLDDILHASKLGGRILYRTPENEDFQRGLDHPQNCSYQYQK